MKCLAVGVAPGSEKYIVRQNSKEILLEKENFCEYDGYSLPKRTVGWSTRDLGK